MATQKIRFDNISPLRIFVDRVLRCGPDRGVLAQDGRRLHSACLRCRVTIPTRVFLGRFTLKGAPPILGWSLRIGVMTPILITPENMHNSINIGVL